MRLSSFAQLLAPTVLLAGLLACGGAYTPPAEAPAAPPATPATALVYTDPTGTGWRLVKDNASTPTHLVLALVGPTGLMSRGVGFNLGSDGTVAFHKFTDADPQKNGNYAQDTNVYKLKIKDSRYNTDLSWMVEPVIFAAGTKQGGKVLTVGIFQKDREQPAQDSGQPLVRIGIDLPASGGPAAGATVPLTVLRARIIPANIGHFPQLPDTDYTPVLNGFRMEDIQVAVGTLKAQ